MRTMLCYLLAAAILGCCTAGAEAEDCSPPDLVGFWSSSFADLLVHLDELANQPDNSGQVVGEAGGALLGGSAVGSFTKWATGSDLVGSVAGAAGGVAGGAALGAYGAASDFLNTDRKLLDSIQSELIILRGEAPNDPSILTQISDLDQRVTSQLKVNYEFRQDSLGPTRVLMGARLQMCLNTQYFIERTQEIEKEINGH